MEVGQLALRCRPLRSARLDPKEWPGLAEPLCIWNAHVCAPHCFPVLRSLAIRRHQLKELLGHLRARDPRRLVLAGDFNATPAWPLYRLLAEELRDAALDAATRRGKSAPPTWGPWSGAPRLLRIDHAFVRGVEVLDARTLRVAGFTGRRGSTARLRSWSYLRWINYHTTPYFPPFTTPRV